MEIDHLYNSLNKLQFSYKKISYLFEKEKKNHRNNSYSSPSNTPHHQRDTQTERAFDTCAQPIWWNRSLQFSRLLALTLRVCCLSWTSVHSREK